MKRYSALISVGIHVILWGLLLILSMIFAPPIQTSLPNDFPIVSILAYAFVFYGTFWGVKELLFKRRVWGFVGLSILLLTGGYLARYQIQRSVIPPFKQVFEHDRFHPGHPEEIDDENRKKPFRSFHADRGVNRFMMGRFAVMNLVGNLLFYCLALSIRLIQKWQLDERQKEALERAKFQSELQFLKQQIHPHFLFNSINSIYALSIEGSPKTTEAIVKLSSMLRYMLYERADERVLLTDELAFIQDYIDLQSLRLTQEVRVEYRQQGDPEKLRIEPFILVPLIENAFKYGADNLHPSFIDIHIEVQAPRLLVHISNRIINDPISYGDASGIGNQNIRRRLELLYPEDHTFQIQESDQIYSVALSLKLRP
ncbi:sensor histidine kinase [Pontibacter sp. G13]|uniref:sensor histidine kinase n=1 Tax=Pontibacter sp. G13 TaxID=3074898 RepID=UPI0028891535|nr:sensor histidine kinase [Pontibacter sp. G13]WNJ18424.1 sensor histidine kinase [Pontibacter sp. G13]